MNSSIPYYKTINEFLHSLNAPFRARNENFFCLRMTAQEGNVVNYKSPYRKDFYFISFINNAGKTQISFDNNNQAELTSFLLFQAPGLIYSFNRAATANGYIIYFKKDLFQFYKPDIDKEFPFFDVMHTNFFRINEQKFKQMQPEFETVFRAYESCNDQHYKLASIKLLSLLYELLDFTKMFHQWEESFTSPKQLLLQKYTQLVNVYYIEKRTVEEYADLLSVTPNHLSQTIKEVSSKNALTYINERLIAEAKSLIQYTDLGMAEIAYQLNFTDPANFGKFFKKMTALTPLEFRKNIIK
jgi:AraC family transcriptional regulator, transcriptional activator of pobA